MFIAKFPYYLNFAVKTRAHDLFPCPFLQTGLPLLRLSFQHIPEICG